MAAPINTIPNVPDILLATNTNNAVFEILESTKFTVCAPMKVNPPYTKANPITAIKLDFNNTELISFPLYPLETIEDVITLANNKAANDPLFDILQVMNKKVH